MFEVASSRVGPARELTTTVAAVIITDLPDHLHEATVELWSATGLTRPWNDPRADLDRALSSPNARILAGLEEPAGPELLATAMVGYDGHRGWIYYLAVQPHHQGHGLARQLLAAAEEWLAGHVPKVQLMIRRDNAPVARFYEHLGYEHSDVTVLSRWLS